MPVFGRCHTLKMYGMNEGSEKVFGKGYYVELVLGACPWEWALNGTKVLHDSARIQVLIVK